MDKNDIDKIEKIIRDREVYHNKLIAKNSKVYTLFKDLDNEAYKDKNLSKMQKELIALGISIVVNCEPCMQHHTQKALDAGATPEQIIEVIEVAIEMSGGPAIFSSRFALKILEYYQNKE